MIILTCLRKIAADYDYINTTHIDLIEVRLDQLQVMNIDTLLKHQNFNQILWTFRSYCEGGGNHSLHDRDQTFQKLIQHKPNYLDLEFERDLIWHRKVLDESPQTHVILSYHCFEPVSFQEIEQKLLAMKKYPAWKYKIAVNAASTLDALKMLKLIKKHSDFIGITMGSLGHSTRLLGPCFSQPITYTTDDEKNVFGQLSSKALTDQYGYSRLNEQTKVYGLVGENLSQSPGVWVYNQLFQRQNINAVYVNFEIQKTEWNEFIQLYRSLGFHGLSITAPLKQTAAIYSNQIGHFTNDTVINTLFFKQQEIHAKNTDVLAVKKLLSQLKLHKDFRVLIIGAGGAAEGVCIALESYRVQVSLANRDAIKASLLAKRFTYNLHRHDIDLDYDLIVKTAPILDEQLIQLLKSGGGVINLLYEEGHLQRLVEQKKGTYISGLKFWIEQGSEQVAWWEDQDAKHLKSEMVGILTP